MKASLELADRRRGFQPDAWQVRPTEAFQRSGFQETAWQEDPHAGTFQDSAFQDEAFQVTEDAFQEWAWQGSAFQIELEPAPSAVVEIERPVAIILQAVNRSSVW